MVRERGKMLAQVARTKVHRYVKVACRIVAYKMAFPYLLFMSEISYPYPFHLLGDETEV